VNFLLISLYEQALGVKVSVPSVFFLFASGGDGEFFPDVMLLESGSCLKCKSTKTE
jgi:hypothetical protein